jgi:hypothetical protein
MFSSRDVRGRYPDAETRRPRSSGQGFKKKASKCPANCRLDFSQQKKRAGSWEPDPLVGFS